MAKDEATDAEGDPALLPFYCPGCGQQYHVERECIGRAEAPHQPILVVSTDELSGDPANHTPAPNTGV